ncbi:hypothetical protein T07_9059 [Trichinella nelsoni]|uniref:Uncharacterized protein n=1 Tax=Trichinella nelsoni TaxID=6336 RepID=A0A0V0SJM1_9BILA|nr:hypothetical protein T07_9059 [Trichinella nelsoni]
MSLEIENNQKPPVELARRWLMRISTFFPSFSETTEIPPKAFIFMLSVGMKGAARFDKDSALLIRHSICSGEVAAKTQVAPVKRLILLQLEFNGRLAGSNEAIRQTEGIWPKKQDSDGTESLREAIFGTKSRGKSVLNQLQQQPRRFFNCGIGKNWYVEILYVITLVCIIEWKTRGFAYHKDFVLYFRRVHSAVLLIRKNYWEESVLESFNAKKAGIMIYLLVIAMNLDCLEVSVCKSQLLPSLAYVQLRTYPHQFLKILQPRATPGAKFLKNRKFFEKCLRHSPRHRLRA